MPSYKEKHCLFLRCWSSVNPSGLCPALTIGPVRFHMDMQLLFKPVSAAEIQGQQSNGPWKKILLYDKRLAQGDRMKPSGYQLRTFSKLNVECIMHLGWNTMNPRPCFWLIFMGIGGKSYFYLAKGEVGESQWISTAEVKSLRVFIFILGLEER